jgi:hypothetical protein
MIGHFKITRDLLKEIRADLARPHPFAHERVGFISTGLSASGDDLYILARSYRPVLDHDYLRDPTVGAMMGPDAIRKALQWALTDGVAIFHVHTHGGRGHPGFSGIDLREHKKYVPNFFQVAPQCAHGALVLSNEAAHGHIWLSEEMPHQIIGQFTEVGNPLKSWSVT